MRTLLVTLCLASFAVGAQSKAKAPEIDTVIILKQGDGYVMQYSEAGRDEEGRPLIRTGDQVPLITDADKKIIKATFDAESARAKPANVGSIVVAKDGRGVYFVQYTAARTQAGRTTQVIGPLVEMASAKDRKEALNIFGLANRARSGK